MSISAKDVKALREETGAGMMDCKRSLVEADGDIERAKELLRAGGLSKAGKRAGRDTSEGAITFSTDGGRGVLIELGCETDFVAKTPDFQGLAKNVADAILAKGQIFDVETALATSMGEKTVDDVIKEAVAKVGENIQLKRVDSVEVSGVVGGYVHGTGGLGVLIALETDKAGDDVDAIVRDVAMHVAAHDPTPIAIDREDMPKSEVDKERTFLTNQALESGKPENVVEKMVDGRINKFFAENCLVEQKFVKDPDKSVREILSEAGRVARFIRFKLGEAAS